MPPAAALKRPGSNHRRSGPVGDDRVPRLPPQRTISLKITEEKPGRRSVKTRPPNCNSTYISTVTVAPMDNEKLDPTEQSRWRPLRLLMAEMDDDIARLY